MGPRIGAQAGRGRWLCMVSRGPGLACGAHVAQAEPKTTDCAHLVG
jgi:hypothetical protein